MSKPATNSPAASRPPVDAIQYEKLALVAFRMCDQHSEQLNKIVTLVASKYRNPSVTSDERRRQRTLMGLLVDTAEDYQHHNGPDRELFEVRSMPRASPTSASRPAMRRTFWQALCVVRQKSTRRILN